MTLNERMEQLDRAERSGFVGFCRIVREQSGDGFCRVSCQIGPEHLNPAGIAHGGVGFTMLDTAAGIAALSLCPEGQGVVTQSADTHFLRPLRPGPARAEARVVRSGGRSAFVLADLLDGEGTLCVHGAFELVYTHKKEA